MIKRLARCIREYKWATIISPLCMVGEVYMEVKIPLVLAKIVDLGVEMSDMGAVVKYGLLLVLYALCSLAFGVASAFFASYAATGFSRNLRHDMYYNVQTFDFSNIDKFSTSSIVTRLTSDVANIQMAFQMMIRMAIRCPMMLILATYNAYSISPRLCLIYCVVLPLLGLGLYILMKTVNPIFDRVFKTYDKLNNVVQENLHGIRVVKSFVREDRETNKFTTVSEEIYKDFCKAERTLAFNNPLMQLAVYTCILVISY
ncbi:MAG: ABC transporter permease, partial [Faecousia sp.]